MNGLARRDMFKAAAGAALAHGLASAPAAALAGAERDFSAVDPEMIDDLRLRNDREVNAASLRAFRDALPAPRAHPFQPTPFPVEPRTMTIPGLPGQPPVRIVVLDPPAGGRPRAALVWIHGGGYVSGSASIPNDLVAGARDHRWLIVSVDYRLAPEAPFPASLNDNYAALKWVHDNAGALNVDPRRVAIGGGSAGGGHAANLALAVRDRGGPMPACQILIYPMLDDRTGSTAQPPPPGTGDLVWSAASNRFGWTSLLNRPAGGAGVPEAAVPARRRSLKGLPPTFIGVGTLDLFLQEDLVYASRLAADGVPVDLAIVPAAYHGFASIAPHARASQAFTRRWLDLLTRTLEG